MKLIGIIAVALSLTACGSSPEGTLKSFYSAVEDAKMDKALAAIAPGSKEAWGGKLPPILASASSNYAKCGGLKSIDVAETHSKGDIWSGTVTTSFKGDCKPQTEKMKLIRIDGKWLINLN